MFDDEVLFLVDVFGAVFGEFSSLWAFIGILQGGVVGCRCNGRCSTAYGNACAVHHHEHIVQSFVGFTDQEAATIASVAKPQVGGAIAFLAHFLEIGDRGHVIGGESSVCIWTVFGHDKKRNSFGAFGCSFDTGKKKVNNVFGILVIASRNEYFLPGDEVMSFIGGSGFSDNVREGASGLWLGQAHGAAPASAEHVGDIGVFEGLVGKMHNQFGRSLCKTGVSRQVIVGCIKNIGRDCLYQ